jgi:general L-amino acid transport system substrate-binding protein
MMIKKNITQGVITLGFVFSSMLTAAQAGETLNKIKKRGEILCGVSTGISGFSAPDAKGEWQGLDVEYCRALAAAVFGDKKKIKILPMGSTQRFTALTSGEIDVLSRVTTHTLTRDTTSGLNFISPNYYDGQAFMVRKKDKITSLKQLNGASICTQQGTTTEMNLTDYFRANNLKFKPVIFESDEEVVQGLAKGRCDAMTTDASGLAADRSRLKDPENYIILEEIISKEPLAAAVKHGDDAWFDIAKWVHFAMIEAEERGITSKNLATHLKSTDPVVKRFLGVTPGNGAALGLSEKWVQNIITQVGNYGEVFNRTVGPQTPLKLERGLNNLWTKKGLMYSPPFN